MFVIVKIIVVNCVRSNDFSKYDYFIVKRIKLKIIVEMGNIKLLFNNNIVEILRKKGSKSIILKARNDKIIR